MFFFFKQKTAYEMRISDWSSDVCSSDLVRRNDAKALRQFGNVEPPVGPGRDARTRPMDKQDRSSFSHIMVVCKTAIDHQRLADFRACDFIRNGDHSSSELFCSGSGSPHESRPCATPIIPDSLHQPLFCPTNQTGSTQEKRHV